MAAALMLMSVFTSCSNDDNDGGIQFNEQTYNAWSKVVFAYGSMYDAGETLKVSQSQLTFHSAQWGDGTFTVSEFKQNEDGSFAVVGTGKVTIAGHGGTKDYDATVNGTIGKSAQTFVITLPSVMGGTVLNVTAGEIPAAVEHALAFSRNGGMIIEKYINGPEVSVNLFLENGEIIFKIITDRESFSEYPGGIIHRHYIPSRFKGTETETAILALARDVARILHVTDGPMYFQIKIEDGKPRLIETSPRLDGCHLWRLIRSYCGADLLEMTVRSLLKKDRLQRADDSVTIGPGGQDGREDLKEKEPYTDDSQRHDQRAAAQEAAGKLPRMVLEFFCQAPGTVFRQSKYADLPASYIQMYYRDGEKVKAVNGYMEKCGYRIIREDELQ